MVPVPRAHAFMAYVEPYLVMPASRRAHKARRNRTPVCLADVNPYLNAGRRLGAAMTVRRRGRTPCPSPANAYAADTAANSGDGNPRSMPSRTRKEWKPIFAPKWCGIHPATPRAHIARTDPQERGQSIWHGVKQMLLMKIGILQTRPLPRQHERRAWRLWRYVSSNCGRQDFAFQDLVGVDGGLPASAFDARRLLNYRIQTRSYEDHDWIPPA